MTDSSGRIGAIASLNARPLTDQLFQSEEIEVVKGAPSVLAKRLHSRQLELALIPQVEIAGPRDYFVLPDLGIACRGRVDSILLFSDHSWSNISQIAVDGASRSSVELLRVLFHLEGYPPPDLTVAPDHLTPTELSRHRVDALLCIGDRALRDRASAVERVDLGEWWFEKTGLPFVFAMWTAHPQVDPRLCEAVRRSAEVGLSRREEIAREFSHLHPRVFTEVEAVNYLIETLHYRLTEEDHASIREFSALRRELGAEISKDWLPRFWEGAS